MTKKSALLGFSGGIDSSAAAQILKDDGYDVTALTLNTTGDLELISNATKRAAQLGVRFEIADVRQLFEKDIIGYFIDGYMSGQTPAPCTVCNPKIKWKTLYDTAKQRGIDHIATGHYFRITEHHGKLFVTKAVDKVKDQSYYLWMLSQEVLRMAITPMGSLIKSQIRDDYGTDKNQKESMGVCFLEGVNYREFISRKAEIQPGEMVNKQGNIVGHHDGYPFYTIGQKRGMGLSIGTCVIAIDAENNRLIIGSDKDLYHSNLIIKDCNITDIDRLLDSTDISVKIRGIGRNPQGFSKISQTGTINNGSSIKRDTAIQMNTDLHLHINLDDPAWAAAVGQPVVLYQNELVVGGGFLAKYY